MTEAVPLFSLLLDVEDGTDEQVQRSLASVVSQTLDAWELVLHGEGATAMASDAANPRIRALLATGPTRVRAQAALGSALGEFAAFMDAGEELAANDVLDTLGRLVQDRSDLDLVYTDEEVVDDLGTVLETVQKPIFSPERLLGHPWVGRLALLRSSLARETCAHEDLLEAWEWDLALRVSASARQVERAPVVLFRSLHADAGLSADDGAEVVREHLRRTGVDAEVTAGSVEGTWRVARRVPDEVSVTLVVPSQGERGLARGERRWFVVEAVRSFLRHAGRARLDVVVVHTTTIERPLRDALLALGEMVRLVPFAAPFCPPAMANLGVLASDADVVVVMDERTEVASDGFLTELMGPLTDVGVGLSAPRVLGHNGTLVDAGLALQHDRAQPVYAGRLATDAGPHGLLTISHECSGLGRACLALRRATFDLVGGLSPALTVAYNVDLSWKVRHVGLRRIWVPAASLHSFGSQHQSTRVPKPEKVALRSRWLAPDLDEYVPTMGAWRAARDRALLRGEKVR